MNLDWIKTIPGYTEHFNEDHKLIIRLIGIDNYMELYKHFGKTGIYFPSKPIRTSDQEIIINLIGEENYITLCEKFEKTGIYFSSAAITSLKKKWVRINRNVPYNEAARILDVSVKSVYNWRSGKKKETTNDQEHT